MFDDSHGNRVSVSDADAGSGTVRVTLSVGCATAPHQGEKVDTLFAAADRALYAAKRGGRNQVVLHQADRTDT